MAAVPCCFKAAQKICLAAQGPHQEQICACPKNGLGFIPLSLRERRSAVRIWSLAHPKTCALAINQSDPKASPASPVLGHLKISNPPVTPHRAQQSFPTATKASQLLEV